MALALASSAPLAVQADQAIQDTFYANGACKGQGSCGASTNSYDSTNRYNRNSSDTNNGEYYRSREDRNTNWNTNSREDSRVDYYNAADPEPLSYNEPVGSSANPSRMNSAADRMNSGAASVQNDAYYNRGYDNSRVHDNTVKYDNARVNQLRNQGFTTSYDTQQNRVTEAMMGSDNVNYNQYGAPVGNQVNDPNFNRAARTSVSISEAQLMPMLNPQTRALYQNLDTQGKALALQLASQSTYTDKNQAVMEAAYKSSSRQGSTYR